MCADTPSAHCEATIFVPASSVEFDGNGMIERRLLNGG